MLWGMQCDSWGCPGQAQELDWGSFLTGHFQLRIFCYTYFLAYISPEMKTCQVLIYYFVLLVLYCPVCQIHGPILEMLVTSSLISASFPKKKQFKRSRRTNSERENTKRSCFSKTMWKVLERSGERTQISWLSDQRFTKLFLQVMHQNLQS